MPAQTRFSRVPRMVAACMERRGAYAGVGESMRSLKRWMDSRGVTQAGDPFCLFYDNPSETPAADLRSEACIPVAGEFRPEGDYKLKVFEATEVAETRHLGPPEEFAKTYGPFLEGLINEGYRILGPAREFFRTPDDVRGPGSGFLIQQPVSEK